jgi:hypothetical protein
VIGGAGQPPAHDPLDRRVGAVLDSKGQRAREFAGDMAMQAYALLEAAANELFLGAASPTAGAH